ncbi:MAG: glycosyltransferase [Chloroflexi bacterium]|nr:glycosyltransferase [Chloroflexota bacterium]
MSKPTILILIGHYLPGTLTGGPVRSVSNLVDWLGDEFDFRILTADRDQGDSAPYLQVRAGEWYSVGKAQVRYLTPAERQLFALGAVLRATRHDLLIVESVLARTSIFALLLRRLGLLRRAPILITPRGHLGQGALQQKSAKKTLFLRAVRLLGLYRGLEWCATSDGERAEIVEQFGQGEAPRIHVIPNLPARAVSTGSVTRPPKRAGALRLIFLSRISRKKNLHFALEALRGLTGEVEFDVYGSLEDAAYWAECQAISGSLPAHIRVCYQGVAPFDGAVEVLAGYHLFYLPTLSENFGHAIWEALVADCPVLISDQTPWTDINAYGAGWALPLDSLAGFTHALQQVIDLDAAAYAALVAQVSRYREHYQARGNPADALRGLLRELSGSTP